MPRWRKRRPSGERQNPHPLNAPGPFYVQNGCCTACGVPESEAPALFAYDSASHCYVKRQPSTSDEHEAMMRVLWGQELACVRYNGEAEATLRRLAELGEIELCDQRPPRDAGPLLRNHARFTDRRKPKQTLSRAESLLARFRAYVEAMSPYDPGGGSEYAHVFSDVEPEPDRISFHLRWVVGHEHPVTFEALPEPEGAWLAHHSPRERVGSKGLTFLIDGWLRADSSVRDIRWFTAEEWRGGGAGQARPY